MSVESHIEQLTQRHHQLEAALREESQRPIPDGHRVKSIKLEKLKIKDEIRRLSFTH
jgi:hypothetical protein